MKKEFLIDYIYVISGIIIFLFIAPSIYPDVINTMNTFKNAVFYQLIFLFSTILFLFIFVKKNQPEFEK